MFSSKWIIALVVTAPITQAVAQGVPPPVPTKTYTFTVSTEELNVILESLAAQPWRAANPVIQKLFQQVKQQDTQQVIPENNR